MHHAINSGLLKQIAAVTLGMATLLGAAAQEVDLEDSKDSACKGQKPERYKAKLFDAMAQIDGGLGARVLEATQSAKIKKIALFARWKLGHATGAESEVRNLAKEHPKLVVPGTPKIYSDNANDSSAIFSMVNERLNDPQYHFAGEILMVHGDKSYGATTASGERFLETSAPELETLMQSAERYGKPVMLHWEVYQWARDWPRMSELYAKHPKATFVWPHAGFASVEQVRMVVDKHPNVMVLLSKNETRPKDKEKMMQTSQEKKDALSTGVVDDCRMLLPAWRALLEEHPNRFLFATDAHVDFRWKTYEKVVHRWRGILGQLSAPTAKAIAWSNAIKLYGLSEEKDEPELASQ
jgi:hypothetical protein